MERKEVLLLKALSWHSLREWRIDKQQESIFCSDGTGKELKILVQRNKKLTPCTRSDINVNFQNFWICVCEYIAKVGFKCFRFS